MLKSNLWRQKNYKAQISYLTSTFIREYDISKANINILFYKGVIDKSMYDTFYHMDRMDRQIKIGLMIKNNPRINTILADGIIEAKRWLFDANDLEDYEVLSIKNDAVYILNRTLLNTKFANIEFKEKNLYTSYYNILDKEYFYYLDPIKNIEKLDIKGINDASIEEHREFFYEFLLEVFCRMQTDTSGYVIEMIQHFYMDYINRRLPINYYREFNSESAFAFRDISHYVDFKAKVLPEYYVDSIDISYNQNILTGLIKIVSDRYFRSR